MDIEHGLRQQLRDIEADHAARMSSIEPLDPLAANTIARHEEETRKQLRNLKSVTPTESPVCGEIEEAEERLLSRSAEPGSSRADLSRAVPADVQPAADVPH